MKFSPFVLKLERKIGACLLRLLHGTIRYRIVNAPKAGYRCVFMFWHRNQLIMAMQHMFTDGVVLVSSSQDGELIAGPLEELGYTTVRGSSTRNGSQALRELIRLAEKHQIGITPDGPLGPAKTIHPGILHIAYMANVPIIPVAVACGREWVFNSWDRFRFPQPFAHITIVYDLPFYIQTKEDIQAAPARLHLLMDNLERLTAEPF